MTTETVTGAVEKRQPTLAEYVKGYSASFSEVLPSHIKLETWLGIAVSVIRRDAKLAAAAKKDPASLLFALLDAARQGLEPGTEQYYLTPRKDKKTGMRVVGIRGYQGEIELIYRAGAVSSVVVEVVRDRDLFIWSHGKLDTQMPPRWEGPQRQPYHDVDWFGERGDLKGVYAYAVMKDGATSKVVVLNKDHIALAMSKSDGADSEYSPWQWNPESMWLKTAVHRLQKFVPTSAEYIREQLRAVRDVQAEQPRPTARPSGSVADVMPAGPDDIEDAELVDDEPSTPEPVDEQQPAAEQPATGAVATQAQLKAVHSLLGKCNVADRDERIVTLARLVGREIGSTSELTKDEASSAINILMTFTETDDPGAALQDHLLDVAQAAEAGR